MSVTLKPYPEYKDSGLRWLGKTPAHWAPLPLRALTEPKNERERADLPLLSVYREYGVIKRDSRDDNYNPEGEDLSTYKAVAPGDLVLNKMKTWQGSLGVSEHSGIVSPAYIVCRLRGHFDRRFLHLVLRSRPYIDHYNRLSFGVRVAQWDMRYQDFKQIRVYFPPVPEQSAIVRFLSVEDARIRRLIRAKRRVIELLNEQKQAIIQRVMTRGLDRSVRFKCPGLDWLGEIPDNWQVVRVKFCSRVISKGTTPSTGGRGMPESGRIRFFKAENVAGGAIVDRPLCFIDEETHALLKRSQLRENDVLFVIAGATLGKVAVVETCHLPANTNQAVAFIRPNQTVEPRYLALWLQSPQLNKLIWLRAVQSAQPNLSMADLGDLIVALPPKREQMRILDWLNARSGQFGTGIDTAKQEIDRIREYRTRLIADVVTGKLDVRGVELSPEDEAMEATALYAEQAPDEAPEEEELGTTEEDANADE